MLASRTLHLARDFTHNIWRTIPFITVPRPAISSPLQPPIQRVQEASSPGLKQPEYDADHSFSSSSEAKNSSTQHKPACCDV
jgi:hypothetical protein